MNADALKQWIFRKRRLRQAYRDCFYGNDGKAHAAGQVVLAQMARFARNREAGLHRDNQGRSDEIAMAYALGMRDFFEMIRLHLAMDDADLYNYERQERQVKPNE